jgi:hypothetical protein
MSSLRALLLILVHAMALGLWTKDSKYLESRRARRRYIKSSKSDELMLNAAAEAMTHQVEDFLSALYLEQENKNFQLIAAPDQAGAATAKKDEKSEESEKTPSAELIYEYMKSRWNHPTNQARSFNLETNYYIGRDAKNPKNIWDLNQKFFRDDEDKS